jgi:hypothetical protein
MAIKDLNKDGEVTPRERRQYKKQADTDKDGTVSPAERKEFARKQETKPDLLSAEELAADYPYAARVFEADPELSDLLDQAVKEQWPAAQFNAKLMSTNWWEDNNEYAREAFAARAMGGADWEATLEDAKNLVRDRAAAIGARVSEGELGQIAEKAITGGWNQVGRQALLDQELSQRITAGKGGMFAGAAGNLQDQLRQIAMSNGVNLSGSYYEAAARSVAEGWTTNDDWLREVRQQAASLWPSWSDKIEAGVSARDLASGYINIMADTFEIMPNSVDLNDPYLRQAMTGVDDKGNPKPMGLFEFQQKLRKDPRWMGTKQAEDQISGIANDVLRMFGFVGA